MVKKSDKEKESEGTVYTPSDMKRYMSVLMEHVCNQLDCLLEKMNASKNIVTSVETKVRRT